MNTIIHVIEQSKWNLLIFKTSTYIIDFEVENNDKDPKFQVGYHLRI